MTRYTRIGAILLIALALGFGAVSAVRAQDTGELELTKTLETSGTIFAGDRITWHVELTNGGPDAEGIEVTEEPGDLIIVESETVAHQGEYSDLVWTIDALAHGASAVLDLVTTIPATAEPGELENCVAITSPDQHLPDTDTNMADNGVCTPVEIGRTIEMLDITVKPETLNLKSRGVFTVFIRLSEDSPEPEITLGDLTEIDCGGATSSKLLMSQKDGGTIIAKFRRQELDEKLVAKGEITCFDKITLSSGEVVKITGTDTIRVIGEKKKGLDAFFAGILDVVLPLDDEAGEEKTGDQTVTTTPTASPSLNRGQLKKAERNSDTVCTENCNAADSQDARGKGKNSGTDGGNSVTGSSDKGDKGNGNDDSGDNGNGKGNSNKPDNEKGNGKTKK